MSPQVHQRVSGAWSCGPHERLGLVRPLVLLRGWLHDSLGDLVKYIIKFLGLFGGFLGYSPSSISWEKPLSTAKGPLAASRSRGDGHGVRTFTLARLHDVQRLSRVMHMHGTTCFSGASVDKVSFNLSPRSVDVPLPGEV